MIDNFSLLLTHGLIFIACWRLLSRDDLDDESHLPGAPSAISPDSGENGSPHA